MRHSAPDECRLPAGDVREPRRCLVCGEPGLKWNAKMHAGACARRYKTRLQRERRKLAAARGALLL